MEVVGPVSDPKHHERLDEVFDILFEDDELAWVLQPDGIWHKVGSVEGNNSHLRLQQLAIDRTR